MSLLKKLKTIPTEYERPAPKKDSWRKRFQDIEVWANANPWDEMPTVTEKDIKLCIKELFEAVDMSCAGFRFIEQKNGSIEALTAAREVANILEGT